MDTNSFFIVLTNNCNLNCKHCYDLKSKLNMSENVLNLSIDYIINKINNSNENEYLINYVGGEIGLYNQDLILASVNKLKTALKDKNITFAYQSNLVYDLNTKHIDVIKEMDEIGTSYDFKIRFNDFNQYIQWINNIKCIQNLNKKIRITSVLTKQLTEELNPQIFLELMLSLGTDYVELNPCYGSINNGNIVNNVVKPINKTVRDWQFELFKLYLKVKKYSNIKLIDFENLIDAYNGNNYQQYARHCSLDNETISPNGNVSTCITTRNKPMFNLVTKQKYKTKQEIYEEEKILNKACKNCKYLKYCKGACQTSVFDETGCPVPYKIIDYLELRGQ